MSVENKAVKPLGFDWQTLLPLPSAFFTSCFWPVFRKTAKTGSKNQRKFVKAAFAENLKKLKLFGWRGYLHHAYYTAGLIRLNGAGRGWNPIISKSEIPRFIAVFPSQRDVVLNPG